MLAKITKYLYALPAVGLALFALFVASVQSAAAQVVIPTPAADLIDGPAVLGAAWGIMPIYTDPLTVFVALSIGVGLAVGLLMLVKRFGRSRG